MKLAKVVQAFAVVASMAACGTASAQTTVQFNGWAYGGSGTTATANFLVDPRTGAASSVSATGGGFNVTINNTHSLAAYSTELFQYSSIGSTYTDYSRVTNAPEYKWSSSSPGINGWDPARADAINQRIGQLWAYAGATYGLTGQPGASDATKQDDSTALQWAIWNVVHDTDDSLYAGNFSIISSGDNETILNTANTMLAQSASYEFRYDVDVLRANGRQDQLIADGVPSPIPEPGTYALMLAGLSAVGFVARRRLPRQG
ncbi:MAG: hypothetical protein RI988_1354 [Pseudomonadota bacterium]|jgi:hypothetical protein